MAADGSVTRALKGIVGAFSSRERLAIGALQILLVAGIAGGGANPVTFVAFEILGSIALLLAIQALVPADQRRIVTRVIAGAFLLRMIVVTGVIIVTRTTGSLAIVGDAAAYQGFARDVAASLHESPPSAWQPPVLPQWGVYLYGPYTFFQIALYYLIGAQVVASNVINSAAYCGAALLIFDSARRLFGPRQGLLAATVVAFFPSLVLWSSVNLKDAFIVLVTSLALWLLIRFAERPRLSLLLAILVVAYPLDGLRRYAFVILCLAIPFAGLLVRNARARKRVGWALAAGAVSASLLLATGSHIYFSFGLVRAEQIRQAMASGARTAFQEPPPAAFPTSAAPTPGAAPTGSATALPAPSTAPVVAGESLGSRDITISTLRYVPTGLTYAFFAPFPWAARRLDDVVLVPEMLLWYVVLGAAAWSIYRHRRDLGLLTPTLLFVAGSFAIFTLAEGNVGTLFRHRGMVVPATILVAAPGLAALESWTRTRWPRSGGILDRVLPNA